MTGLLLLFLFLSLRINLLRAAALLRAISLLLNINKRRLKRLSLRIISALLVVLELELELELVVESVVVVASVVVVVASAVVVASVVVDSVEVASLEMKQTTNRVQPKITVWILIALSE